MNSLTRDHFSLGHRFHGLQGFMPPNQLLFLALDELPERLIDKPIPGPLELCGYGLKAFFDVGLKSHSCNAHQEVPGTDKCNVLHRIWTGKEGVCIFR